MESRAGAEAGGGMISLDLPMPPSLNGAFPTVRRGASFQRVASKKYLAWKQEAGWLVKTQLRGDRIAGPFDASIAILKTDNRRSDIDNRVKPVLDLLVSLGVVDDDSLCRRVTAKWVREAQAPCRVTLTPAEAA